MSKTKKNPLSAPTQIIVHLDIQAPLGQFATRDFFGQAFIEFFIKQLLKGAAWDDLIIICDQHADQLRSEIKRLALHLPIKIRVLSQTQVSNFANDLLLAAPYLQPEFFLLDFENQAANFQLRQLSNYQADGVFAVDQEQNLLNSYLLKKKFIDFLQKQPPDKSWEAILSAFSVDFLVKNVVFDSSVVAAAAPKNPETLWWQQLQKYWQFRGDKSQISPQAQIAPTVRLRGPVVIEASASINEYSVIEGPAYLGKNSTVGCFCHLQNVVIEKNETIVDYTSLKEKYLGATKE